MLTPSTTYVELTALIGLPVEYVKLKPNKPLGHSFRFMIQEATWGLSYTEGYQLPLFINSSGYGLTTWMKERE
jgi:hypothetical protein